MASQQTPADSVLNAGDAASEVLAKLDRLLAKHRPASQAADPATIPVLSAATSDLPVLEEVPVLTEVVGGPGLPAPNVRLEEARIILRRLLQLLQSERARWARETGEDPQHARIAEAVIGAIETALPNALAEAASTMAANQHPTHTRPL
ncbi:MAG: hypothetical protein ACKVP2_12675 [Burkholderiales bacterium]